MPPLFYSKSFVTALGVRMWVSWLAQARSELDCPLDSHTEHVGAAIHLTARSRTRWQRMRRYTA